MTAPEHSYAEAPEDPELIFSIVRPVGIDHENFLTALRGKLNEYGYRLQIVRLSSIISDETGQSEVFNTDMPEADRINMLMDSGDQLCQGLKLASAIAIYGVNEIRELRQDVGGNSDEPIQRMAYLVDSVKRTEESAQLRWIYGERYIQVGLQASDARRIKYLESEIQSKSIAIGPAEITKSVRELVERDLRESGDYGQNVLKTFPLSDVFIDMEGDVSAQVGRLLDLLFGNPDYPVPTPEEYGMQLAFISSTRSPELGLKVGSALFDADQRIMSLGVNVHPISPTASPVFDLSATYIKELIHDTVTALSSTLFTESAKQELASAPDSFVRSLLSGALKNAKIKDLIEFQPTVHAEMNSLIDALKRGVSVDGATMYVTAYPCHGCAKHLVALNMKVVYLEPYPKSRAGAMYAESVVESFRPFTGIAPIRYEALFKFTEDRKQKSGRRMEWKHAEKTKAQPKVGSHLDGRGIALREVAALAVLDDSLNSRDSRDSTRQLSDTGDNIVLGTSTDGGEQDV